MKKRSWKEKIDFCKAATAVFSRRPGKKTNGSFDSFRHGENRPIGG